jgi:hypothetical protein
MEPVERRRRSSKYAAGITNIESNCAVIIPPTIGAAMWRMTSEPVPLPHGGNGQEGGHDCKSEFAHDDIPDAGS